MPESTTTGIHQTQHSNRIGWGWWVVAAIGGAVAVAIVGAALIASLRSGHEIDSTAVMLALIALLSGIAALVVPKLNAVGRNTSETAEHVSNSHSTNLRDDIDEIKRISLATAARMGQLEQTMSYQARDMLGIRDELGQIRKSERDQWDAIENTDRRQRQNKE